MCFTYEVLETFCNLPFLAAKPKKQPPPHPALPYDATAGAPHSAESAPSHGVAPRSLQAPHPHHPTAPRLRFSTPLHPCRSMMLGTHRIVPPHRTRPFSQRCTCAAPWRRARIDPRRYLRHTMLPSPTPLTVPRWVRLAPLGTAPELPGVWKQKSDQNCNFFAIGNSADVQITDRAPKMKQNDRPVPHFHFTGDEKRAANRKKVAKAPGFLFRKANYRNRSRFRNEPIAKGKSRNELIAATRRTPRIMHVPSDGSPGYGEGYRSKKARGHSPCTTIKKDRSKATLFY